MSKEQILAELDTILDWWERGDSFEYALYALRDRLRKECATAENDGRATPNT